MLIRTSLTAVSVLALACSDEDRARLEDSPWAGLLAQAAK